MELSQQEDTAIRGDQGLINRWMQSPTLELEATFGQGGVIDIQTFLRVIEYLQNVRKLEFVAPVDYLTISVDYAIDKTTKQRYRFQVDGTQNVERYCRSNKLEPGTFTCMRKNPASKSKVELHDYFVKLKMAEEHEDSPDSESVKRMIASWSSYDKYFRLIKRWSFLDTKRNVRYDLSMVRCTDNSPLQLRDGTQKKRPLPKTFKEQPLLENTPRFEIEVEILRPNAPTVAGIFTHLMYSVVDVLRAIQNATLLITNSEKRSIQDAYFTLTAEYQPKDPKKQKGFIGFNPVTLKLENVTEETIPGEVNIRSFKKDGKTTYYNVTDKADGLRCFGYVAPNSEFYLIDMSMNIYKTGLSHPGYENSLVDGEYITKNGHTQSGNLDTLYIFDYYIGPKGDKEIRSLPFYDGTPACRFHKLEGWTSAFHASLAGSKPKFAVQLKSFEFASKKEGEQSIFAKASRIWAERMNKPYHTDGLIFTPNASPLPSGTQKLRWNEQFKWKPADQNTIDFLIVFEQDKNGESVFTEFKNGALVDCKKLLLFVMSDKLQNLREEYLKDVSLGFLSESKYRPVIFNPMDPPDLEASRCRVELQRDETGEGYTNYIQCEESHEIIYDSTVVEMAYDPKRPVGWRWYPMRVRQDKTERYRRAIAERKPMSRVMNDAGTANDVWNSIHNPVTETIITTGEIPVVKDEKPTRLIEEVYYERKPADRKKQSKDADKTVAMRDFHKKHIKGDLLFNAIRIHFQTLRKKAETTVRPTLLDLACGIGGDVTRYLQTNPYAVLGIDKSGKNILDPETSAYSFFLDKLQKMRRKDAEAAPSMFFVIGDTSKDIRSGECSRMESNTEDTLITDRSILQALFGEQQEKELDYQRVRDSLGVLKEGVDAIVLMFALHYFFETKESFDGLISNLAKTLKVGGLFAGCNFDGEAVFEYLRTKDVQRGEVQVGKGKKEVVWEIQKKYESNQFETNENAFGLKIDIMFKSISERPMPEWLVNWKLFVDAMKTIGCELLSEDEAKRLQLPASTQMFKTTYESLEASKKPTMDPALQDYSFLNRWWVFRRTSMGQVVSETVGDESLEEGKVSVQPQVGVPAPLESKKSTWDIVDTLSPLTTPMKLLLSGEDKLYAKEEDIPKDIQTFLSPMRNLTYTHDGVRYPSFYAYLYGRMLKEAGTGAVQAFAQKFETGGELARQLKSSLDTKTTMKLKHGVLFQDSDKSKKIVDKLLLDEDQVDIRNMWDVKTAIRDALRQRFEMPTEAAAKKLLCYLAPRVAFEYRTSIDPTIGILGRGGKNVYGEVLQSLAEELCGSA